MAAVRTSAALSLCGSMFSYMSHGSYSDLSVKALCADSERVGAGGAALTSRKLLAVYGLSPSALLGIRRRGSGPGSTTGAEPVKTPGKDALESIASESRTPTAATAPPLPPRLQASLVRASGGGGDAKGLRPDLLASGGRTVTQSVMEEEEEEEDFYGGSGGSGADMTLSRRGEGDMATAIARGSDWGGAAVAVEGGSSRHALGLDAGAEAGAGGAGLGREGRPYYGSRHTSMFDAAASHSKFGTPLAVESLGGVDAPGSADVPHHAPGSGYGSVASEHGHDALTGAAAYVQRASSARRHGTPTTGRRSTASGLGSAGVESVAPRARRSLLSELASPPGGSGEGSRAFAGGGRGDGGRGGGRGGSWRTSAQPHASLFGGDSSFRASSAGDVHWASESFADHRSRGEPEPGAMEGRRRGSAHKRRRRLVSAGGAVYADLDDAEAVLREHGLDGRIGAAAQRTREVMGRILAEVARRYVCQRAGRGGGGGVDEGSVPILNHAVRRRLDAANSKLQGPGTPDAMRQEAVTALLDGSASRAVVPWLDVPVAVSCEDALVALYPKVPVPQLKAVLIERFQVCRSSSRQRRGKRSPPSLVSRRPPPPCPPRSWSRI